MSEQQLGLLGHGVGDAISRIPADIELFNEAIYGN
jgi:hypothetical protein